MPDYQLPNGEIVNTDNFSAEELERFFQDFPDATTNFQNGAAGTGAPVVPETNQVPSNGVYDFLDGSLESVEARSSGAQPTNAYLIENPGEREVVEEYRNKRGRLVKKYADPTPEELFRDVVNNLDEPEFISNSRGRKVKNPKYVAPENRPTLEQQALLYNKDNDLDIEYTNKYFNKENDTWFVDKYYDKNDLASAGLSEEEIQDFQGMLMRDDFINSFEKDVADGVYGELSSLAYVGDEKRNIQVAKERALATKLSQYISERDSRLNDKMLIQNIIENPDQFDQSKSFDEIKEEAYKNSNIGYTQYDQKALSNYIKTNFPELSRKNAENQQKKIEAAQKRREFNKQVEEKGIEGIANFGAAAGELVKNLGEGFYKRLDEVAIWIDDTIGVFGGNERAKQQRLLNIEDEIADTDSLEYFYIDGKGVDINGVTYIKDERGNIYDTNEGINVSEVLDPFELKSISQEIDKEGTKMDDYSFRGGAVMGGEVVGGIIFDVIGTKGVGTARVGSSALYTTALGVSTRARGAGGRFISTKETFGVKLPFNAQMADAVMYYSFIGGVTGYENTMKAAMQAGLSNEEAEKLADQAQLKMMALYGLTTPINPRISFVNKLDDLVSKNKIYSTAVNEYKKANKSQLAFGESLKEQIKQTGLTTVGKTVAFVKYGAKEFVQENVQQYGELEIVNESINQSVGMDLLQADYNKQDFVNTSILSFAAGGLLGALSAPGSKIRADKRLQNLYILSRDLKGAKRRFDQMVDSNRLSREDADNILNQAKSVGESLDKMPAWMLKTPEELIEASVVQSQIDEVTKQKNKLAEPMRVEANERIKELKDQLGAIREKAANQLVTQETKVIEGIVGTDNVKSFETAAEMVEAIAKVKGDQYSLDDMMLDMTSDGFIEQDGVIYINKEVAAKTQAISVASHELLHKVLKSEFKNNPEMKRVVNEFKEILKKKGIFKQIEARADMYRKRGIGDVDGKDMDEYFTFFSDAIAKDEIPFEALQESQWTKIGKSIAKLFNTRFGTKNLRFSSGQQVFDFIKDYQAGIQKGKLTGQAKKKLKAGTEVEDTKKKSVSQKGLDKTKQKLNALKDGNKTVDLRTKMEVFEELPTMIDVQVKNLAARLDDNIKEELISDVQERILRLNKQGKSPDLTFNGTGQVYGFLNGRIRNRLLDALRDDRKRVDPLYINRIDTDALTILEKQFESEPGPKVKSTPEPKKYKNLIDSKILPEEIAAKVKQKVISTTRVLKSRIDAAVSLNTSTTPLIAEIKKEIGKQADIEFKKIMGGKEGKKLRNWTIKNKKAIVENATTTWLMGKNETGSTIVRGGIPIAIEKSVGGRYTGKKIQINVGGKTVEVEEFIPKFVPYPEWAGQKIDREKTAERGQTSGNQIVRRVNPNEISDKDFADFITTEDGTPIRGRKEALAKAMAEEYAFDLYNQELKNPDSDIRKALETNQERLGVELADNFVQEFSKQAERGNVKRSASAATLQNIRLNVSTLVKAIQKKGYNNVLDGETIIDESLKDINPEAVKLTIQAYDLGLMSTAEVYRFLQAIKASDQIPENIKKKAAKAVTKTSNAKTKQRLAKDAETIAMALGKDIIDAIGLDALGFINRVLDPAERKIDEAATQKNKERVAKELNITLKELSKRKEGKGLTIYKEGVTGDFYNVVERVNKNIKPSQNLPKNLDLSLVSPMNSKIGVMAKIERILNKEITAEQKKEEYKKLIPEIEAANVQNKILAKHIIKTMLDLLNKGRISPVSFINILQLQTNAAKGLRALTGLKYITFRDVPQGKQKGEHLADNSTSMFEVAELGFSNMTPAELDLAIDEILEFHDQWLENRELLDFVDVFGKNNPFKDRRIELLPKADQKFVFTYDLQPASTLIETRSNAINTAVKIKEGVIEFQPIKTEQQALNNARKYSYSANPKGISVYDFDDTLAFSKSKVIVKMPQNPEILDIAARRMFAEEFKDKPAFLRTFDNLTKEQQEQVEQSVPRTTKRITPAEFARDSEKLTDQGADFDFSEFNKVVEGTAGPLAPRLKKAIGKFGNKNIFVLTARPPESKYAIHEFLKGLGLELPLENIVGLANGDPKAKAAWMVTKVADGFNDFYFVDDHLGNVKAVKEALNNFDVKGKVQQARLKRSVTMSEELNKMIERNKGVRSETTYSKIKARKDGAKKGRFKAFLPYGAEDFRGLTSYTLAGKGKQGEADQKFFEDNLVRPYLRGVAAMEVARRTLKTDFRNLLKNIPGMKRRLGKKIGDTDFTVDQAVRVYLWTQQGQEIPDISKRDQKKLNSLVAKDPDLVNLANGLQAISKQDTWVEPSEHWIAGSILKDINDIGEVVNRKEYLQEFNENVDIIFDEKNMNKLEAIYGTRYVNALKNSLARMKSGRNRPAQPGAYEQQWLNWVNNSVGTIMFFNRRSALMQMLSFANFVNWGDNNPLKAGIAFANQPAYWRAWSKIFNSPKLKERRGGLKSDVQEQEIANQAKNSKDKAGAVIAYLLKIGFTPTQLADSFAIATGGATFLINRTKTYKKQGLSQADAEAKAFEDFSAISDETQQSGDPMLISAQQASHLGRLVLAFQNTPMQYTRLMKKAAQDIANGRGDFKTNMSKILYYGFVQNLIFSALQNALFALIPGFDDEEPEEDALDKKTERILNNMLDTILRGSGLTGAVVSTLKNAIMRYQKEEEKGFTADHAYTILELVNVSPPIGSKARKVYNAIQTKKFDGDVMKAQGWDPTLEGKFNVSPYYEITGQLSSAFLNLPLDRMLAEVDAISEALDTRNTSYQRLALGLGWRTWDVDAKKEEEEYVKLVGKLTRKEEGKKKAKATREKKKQEELDRLAAMTPAEKQKYLNDLKRKRSESARKAAETRRINKRKKDSILSLQ